MVSATYQQRNQERLAQAIESCKLYEEFGFATVASTSEPNKFYFVDFNENYYATACSCQGNSEFGADCLHCLALDRVGDSLRPDFYTMNGIQRPAKQQVSTPAATTEPVETHRIARVRGAGGTAWYPEYLENGQWFRYPEPGTTHSVHFLDESSERAEQWLANRLASQVSHEREGQLPQETRQKLYNWKQSESGDQMEREYIAAQETADSNMRHFYDEY